MTFVKQFPDEVLLEQRMIMSESDYHYWFESSETVFIMGYIEVINKPDPLVIDGKHYIMLGVRSPDVLCLFDDGGPIINRPINDWFHLISAPIVDWEEVIL